MKLFLTIISLVAVLAFTSGAMAAGSNTLTVTAAVAGTCRFVSATSTLAFGSLDPSVGTDANASGSTTFWCTKGTTESISANNGASWDGTKRNMLDSVSGDLIPYTLTLTPDGNPNAGPGSPRTLAIAGTVLGTDYTAKSAGSYTDTVTLSITP